MGLPVPCLNGSIVPMCGSLFKKTKLLLKLMGNSYLIACFFEEVLVKNRLVSNEKHLELLKLVIPV